MTGRLIINGKSSGDSPGGRRVERRNERKKEKKGVCETGIPIRPEAPMTSPNHVDSYRDRVAHPRVIKANLWIISL